MNSKHFTLCLGLAAVAALALFAGLPPFYLLILACPLMMLVMMTMMPGMHSGRDQADASKTDRTDEHTRSAR